MTFYRIIKIENSIDEFKKLETDLSLKKTELLQHTVSKHHIEKNPEPMSTAEIIELLI